MKIYKDDIKRYKVTFFENSSQSIQERYFYEYEKAYKWATNNLEKNQEESITKINYPENEESIGI